MRGNITRRGKKHGGSSLILIEIRTASAGFAM